MWCSASWGPTDDGKTVDGPRELTLRAIVDGVNKVIIEPNLLSKRHRAHPTRPIVAIRDF